MRWVMEVVRKGIEYVLLFLLALVARQRNELLVLLSLSRRHGDWCVSVSVSTDGRVKCGD